MKKTGAEVGDSLFLLVIKKGIEKNYVISKR